MKNNNIKNLTFSGISLAMCILLPFLTGNDMALGNAVGSCIFNILMVLGIASAISPIAFIQENIIDIIVLVVFSLIVWIMAWTKREIKRGEGIIMLLKYAAYTAYIIILYCKLPFDPLKHNNT